MKSPIPSSFRLLATVATASTVFMCALPLRAAAGPLPVLKPTRQVVFDTSAAICLIDGSHRISGESSPGWGGICIFTFHSIQLGPQVQVSIHGGNPLCLRGEDEVSIAPDLRLAGGNGAVGGGGGGGGGALAVFSQGAVDLGAVNLGGGKGGNGSQAGSGGNAGWLLVSAGKHVGLHGVIELGGGAGGRGESGQHDGSSGAGGCLIIAARDGVKGSALIQGCAKSEFYLNDSVAAPTGQRIYSYEKFQDRLSSGELANLLVGDRGSAVTSAAVAEPTVSRPAVFNRQGQYKVECDGFNDLNYVGQKHIRDCSIATLTALLTQISFVHGLKHNRASTEIPYEKLDYMLRKGPWSYMNHGEYVHGSNFLNVANWGLKELNLPGRFVSRRALSMDDVERALRDSQLPVALTIMTRILSKATATAGGIGRGLLKGITFGAADMDPVLSDYQHSILLVRIENRPVDAGYKRYWQAVDPWRGLCFKRKSGRLIEFDDKELSERFLSYKTFGLVGEEEMVQTFRSLAPEGSMLIYQP